MVFAARLKRALEQGEVPEKTYKIVLQLYESYARSLELAGFRMQDFDHLFDDLLMLMIKHLKNPFYFGSYHKRILEPYNYFRFGIEFIRPLVDQQRSRVLGIDTIKKISNQLRARKMRSCLQIIKRRSIPS